MSSAGGPERDPDDEARAWDDIVRRLRDDDEPTAPEPAADRELAADPEAEDDWEPEDPGDVTAGMRPGTLMAWGVLLGVSAVLLVLGFLLEGLPWWLWFPGLALVLGSLVSLFQALPEQRGDDDDGARV
ncbi:hypothetical protein [Kocuria palustris]|uniref:hypothetical protein n=1 Tax=Kocuria palustris TaxID=71999 RepID=UPI00119ED021|nr:hypothetical protein [Kocuria palustris]